MAELKLTNNPCKYCNKEIGEGEPICGDIVNMRCNMCRSVVHLLRGNYLQGCNWG